MAPSADSRAPAIALLGCLSAFAVGQATTPQTTPAPVLHAAFAAAPARHQVPALAWLCERHLPARREWPATLDPRQAFAVRLDADGLRILETADLRHELSNLRVPSLWVAGRRDRLVPVAGIQAAAELVPLARR